MTKLVEQGGHFIVGQQRWGVAHGGAEVTDQIGDGQLHTVFRGATHATVVHPGAAAFFRAGVKIQIESGDLFAVFRYMEEARIRVVSIEFVLLFKLNAI